MFKDLSQKEKYILAGILILAAILIFFNLTRVDIQGDDAHYSFRAIGYTDFMASTQQTTPYQWFGGNTPWWTKLSFHDHPPLVFLIQHIFFKVFGVNDVAAKLPFALAGWALILVVFLLGKELYNAKVGLAAAFILSINSYHIWISRIGCFESMAILFMALSLLFLIKGKKSAKNFLLAGVFLGLAALSKYVAFFLAPVFLIYALINFKLIFKNKYFWLGLIIALVIFSPVIFYNIKAYQTRGHADVQFTALFSQSTDDWPILSPRSGWKDRNLLTSFPRVFKDLGQLISWPLLAVFGFSILYLIWELITIWRLKSKDKHCLLISLLIFASCFFALTGSGAHYLAPFNFILALIVGRAAISIFKLIRRQKMALYIYLSIILCLAFYSLIFTFNTNHASAAPVSKFWYSHLRLENLGFRALDKFLSQELKNKVADSLSMSFPEVDRYNPLQHGQIISDEEFAQLKNELQILNQELEKSEISVDQERRTLLLKKYDELKKIIAKIDKLKKEGAEALKQSLNKEENLSFYIYDDNTKWFPRVWYLERWRFYHFFPFIAARELKKHFQEIYQGETEIDYDYVYFIKSMQKKQLDRPDYTGQCPDVLQKALENYPDKEVIELKNKEHQVMFKIYKFKDIKLLAACEDVL